MVYTSFSCDWSLQTHKRKRNVANLTATPALNVLLLTFRKKKLTLFYEVYTITFMRTNNGNINARDSFKSLFSVFSIREASVYFLPQSLNVQTGTVKSRYFKRNVLQLILKHRTTLFTSNKILEKAEIDGSGI